MPALTRLKILQDRMDAATKGEKAGKHLGIMIDICLEAYAKGWITEVLTSVIRSRPRFRPYLYAEFAERMLGQGLYAQASAFLATYRTASLEDEETPPDLVILPPARSTPEMDLDHLVNIWMTAGRFSHLEFVHRTHEAVLDAISKAHPTSIAAFVDRTEDSRTDWETENLLEALQHPGARLETIDSPVARQNPTAEPLRRVR